MKTMNKVVKHRDLSLLRPSVPIFTAIRPPISRVYIGFFEYYAKKQAKICQKSSLFLLIARKTLYCSYRRKDYRTRESRSRANARVQTLA